jgi:CRP-like cAMP-binding protein
MSKDLFSEVLSKFLLTHNKQVYGRPKGYLTANEISKSLGVSREAIMRRLRVFRDEGKLLVKMVTIVGLDGKRQRVPAYKLKK